MLNSVNQGRTPETTLQCIQHLRRHLPRSRISVEVEKSGRAGLRELAKEADIVFYSKTWAEVSRILWPGQDDHDHHHTNQHKGAPRLQRSAGKAIKLTRPWVQGRGLRDR